MTYRAVPIPRFDGGLVLQAQPDVLESNQAVDLLNVTFSEKGAVRRRDGYAKLTTFVLPNVPDSLAYFYTSAGTKRMVVGNGNRIDVINESGGSVAGVATTASPHFFARFGGPTREAVYIANGTDQIRRYDTAGFALPASLAAETGKFLAVWSEGNRLVAANEGGTTAGQNPSSVRFSAAGDPETFTPDTYEDITPGDGEPIMGICAWRELLFVFKRSKFAVFTGVGTNLAGNADPVWRMVDGGVGLASSRALAVGRDGVYFLDRKGVYKTTGGEAQQVSDPLDPFFNGDSTIYFRSNTLNVSQIEKCAMTVHDERVYLSCPTGTSVTNDRTLVFDPRYGWWSLYDLPAAALTTFQPGSGSSREELVFAHATQNHIARHARAYTADLMESGATGGTAITSRWRSGWQDFGDPNVKTVRETRLWGQGRCNFKLYRDFKDAGSSSVVQFSPPVSDLWAAGATPSDVWAGGTSSDLWGPTRSISPKLVRQSRRGTVFSMEFSGQTLNETWTVHRADHHLRDQKIPSTLETEVA